MHHFALMASFLLGTLLLLSPLSKADTVQANIPFEPSAALEHSMDGKTCEIVQIYANSKKANSDNLLAVVWYDLKESNSLQVYESLNYWPVLYLSIAGSQQALLLRSTPFNVRQSTTFPTELQWANEHIQAIVQLGIPQHWVTAQDGTQLPLQKQELLKVSDSIVRWHGTLMLQTPSQSKAYSVLIESHCAP